MIFTFHSGYILIQAAAMSGLATSLYIPFWLYSNFKAVRKFTLLYKSFTFHSGYILMKIV